MTIKDKTKLFLITLIILSICLVVFIISPFLKEIQSNSAEIISQKESLISLEERRESLEIFKNQYQEISSGFERMETLFVDAEVPIDFIHFLEKTTSDAKIDLQISSAIASQPADTLWPSLGFQITTVSSYPNLLRFLEKLENSQYLVEIKNISINKIKQEESKKDSLVNAVRTNLSLWVFVK